MRMRARSLSLLIVAAAACGGSERVTAPAGASAFHRFVSMGTGFTMGEQSAGVVYESQLTSWPAQLAARMEATFRVPALRSPGCSPPLVAPLSIYRNLAGTVVAGATGCNGRLGSDSLPANNVAMSGATAWDALHTTPRSFVTLPSSLDQVRYPMVLPAVQTQLQAMQSQKPTLVAVELGAGEVLRAMTTGLVAVGTSYTQKTAWTLMPAAVFAPVFDSIADSVAATKAKAVFLGMPPLMSLAAFQGGDDLWRQRTALATIGVEVDADCQETRNLLNAAVLLPSLVAAARSTGKPEALSCADRPGVVDYILTPADVVLIQQTITALNGTIKAAAEKRRFAYAEPTAYWLGMPYGVAAFVTGSLLNSDAPFGQALSLDGVHPSATGQRVVADVVARALNQQYGWAIPISATVP